jgi:hypothetical protein
MRRFLISTSLIALLSITTVTGSALAEEPAVPADDGKATVFYFHGDRRCKTCRSIEQAADTVVHEQFGDKLKSGDLAWKVINFDKEKNSHYIKDLSLAGSGVVIARVLPSGEIRDAKVLQDVWRLSRDEAGMSKYLFAEITEYLGDN